MEAAPNAAAAPETLEMESGGKNTLLSAPTEFSMIISSRRKAEPKNTIANSLKAILDKPNAKPKLIVKLPVRCSPAGNTKPPPPKKPYSLRRVRKDSQPAITKQKKEAAKRNKEEKFMQLLRKIGQFDEEGSSSGPSAILKARDQSQAASGNRIPTKIEAVMAAPLPLGLAHPAAPPKLNKDQVAPSLLATIPPPRPGVSVPMSRAPVFRRVFILIEVKNYFRYNVNFLIPGQAEILTTKSLILIVENCILETLGPRFLAEDFGNY